MPLVVLPALIPDIERVYDIYFAAFKNERMAQLMLEILFPKGVDAEFRKAHTANTLAFWHISTYQYTFKCVDTANGNIVGMGLGDIHIKSRTPEERQNFGVPWLEGAERERAEKVLNPLWEVKEKIWGGRPHIYIHVIGVAPEHQGKYAGVALIKWGIDMSEQSGLPVYCEASPSTYTMYQKFGFKILKEKLIHKKEVLGTEDDIEVPLMVRLPTAAGQLSFEEWAELGYPSWDKIPITNTVVEPSLQKEESQPVPVRQEKRELEIAKAEGVASEKAEIEDISTATPEPKELMSESIPIEQTQIPETNNRANRELASVEESQPEEAEIVQAVEQAQPQAREEVQEKSGNEPTQIEDNAPVEAQRLQQQKAEPSQETQIIEQQSRPEQKLQEQSQLSEPPVEVTDSMQTANEHVPAENMPVEQTTLEQTPMEETSIEKTPLEQTPVEQTSLEKVQKDESLAEKLVYEEIPTQRPTQEDVQVEQKPVDAIITEQTPNENTSFERPQEIKSNTIQTPQAEKITAQEEIVEVTPVTAAEEPSTAQTTESTQVPVPVSSTPIEVHTAPKAIVA